ncbi:MAG: Xaa-Pro dipeptidase [Proteobacteria bacterium]|nr:Xaa-Pro dipeptidase [Pseudomonadota bacterium]
MKLDLAIGFASHVIYLELLNKIYLTGIVLQLMGVDYEQRKKSMTNNQHISWISLHENHVNQLKTQYDHLFRKYSDLDCIVIHSCFSPKKNSLDDQYWPSAQTPMFTHWTPYKATPALIVLKGGEKPELYIEQHTSFWEGPAPENDDWCKTCFKITEVKSLTDAPVRGRGFYIGDEALEFANFKNAPELSESILNELNQLRMVKSEYEVQCIKTATARAAPGHVALNKIFMDGTSVSEFDLLLEYLRATNQTENSAPYGNIVALGTNAAILHHVHYDRKKVASDCSLLLDAGADCNGYASDITRTWVRGSGRATQKFRAIVDALEKLQLKLVEAFECGKMYQDLHDHCHAEFAQFIIDFELSTASLDELVASKVSRTFFPHGLGHSLGIQVHDVGTRLIAPRGENQYLRNTSRIVPGQIATVEPGFYFIKTLLEQLRAEKIGDSMNWPLIQELSAFGGIRIEDNVLATEQGPVNLTRQCLNV